MVLSAVSCKHGKRPEVLPPAQTICPHDALRRQGWRHPRPSRRRPSLGALAGPALAAALAPVRPVGHSPPSAAVGAALDLGKRQFGALWRLDHPGEVSMLSLN